jgi:hypothetical protein
VLDRLRNDLALKYARKSDLGLAQVALLLGYANHRRSPWRSADRQGAERRNPCGKPTGGR